MQLKKQRSGLRGLQQKSCLCAHAPEKYVYFVLHIFYTLNRL